MAESRRIHRGWATVAAALLVAILVATLTPTPGTPVTANFWCFACGELGALDVAANVIMFVPFGIALALATERRWLSVVVCVATTLAVELLQVRVVAGRDAAVSDLLANSLGGWIGVELALRWRPVIHPSQPAATRLAMAGGVLFAAVCALTSAGLEPATVPRSLWIQWMPPRATYEPFTGRVLAFDVDGMDLPVGRQLPPRGLARALSGPQWQATTTIATDSLQPRRSVIVRIAEEFTVLVSVEQVGRDFVCLQKTRSADFKFRSPKVAANDALAAAVGENTSPVKLTCARRHAWLVAGVDGNEARLRLSPALGWLLLSPFDFAITTREAWVGWLWLLGLAVPAGYWAGTIRGSDVLARKRRRTAAAAIAVSLVAGLSLAPLATTTSPGDVREWVAAITGVVLGLLVARAARPASSR